MFWRFRKSRDFGQEIEAHLSLEADRLREHRLSEEEALLEARRLFGNPTGTQEQFHMERPWFVLETVWQDVRFGLRMLAKHRGTTLVTLLRWRWRSG